MPERSSDAGPPLRSRVQDVDRPAHIEVLPEPAGARRARAEAQAEPVVTRPENHGGVPPHHGSLRNLRQQPAVRPPEPKRPVGPARDLIALLVDGAVMPAAKKREVREGRGASLGPVMDVMALAEADAAAREAAARVSVAERPA